MVATHIFVAPSSLYSYACGNRHDIIFFYRDIFFFFGPCCWLSCFLRHRNLCCEKLDLVNLSSNTISITTDFSSVEIEFYHSLAFIVATYNFFVATEIRMPSILYYVATNFFVATENSPPSCIVCRDKNNLCHDRYFVALCFEF